MWRDSAITARMTCSISRMVMPVSSLRRRKISHHAVGLGRTQSGHHLVEQQERRLGRERARNLKAFAVRQSDLVGDREALVVKADQVQHRPGIVARFSKIVGPAERADRDIFLAGQRAKRPHDLERAADPGAADLVRTLADKRHIVKHDRAGVGLEDAGDQIEDRGLAGAVRPDQRMNARRA